ncbi:MAG: hypothetical protein AMJ38_01040 [Dehalococcoidia bacterium DG_22]|nr:MAG: hypothetical protein AMJ38_01040 [Dehalococcoidia bacterium DG_22]
MRTHKSQLSVWNFENRRVGFGCTATLVAYWEVYLDPISDDFTPDEISAAQLLSRWANGVREKYPDELIPISWFVRVDGENVKTFEYMPFQFEHFPLPDHEDFLTLFTWPVNVKTGRPLNWMELPVADKLWRPGRSDKGGFIQEATGWKPSMLQPHVYLPSLEKAVHR